MTHHIAFLGTGIMGAPMAANLIKAGFTINRDFRPGAPIRNFVKDLDTVLATAGEIGLPQLPIVKAVRDVFKALYDQGHERWDHSAFLLYLEKMNAPTRLGDKANTPPER